MTDLTLTKTRFRAGVWEGVLTSAEMRPNAPELSVTHLDQPVGEVSLRADTDHPGTWFLRIELPASLLADGMQTVLIYETDSDERLGTVTVLAGEALDDDIRAEMDLLRAELDMLKRAFRRHCVEVMD
jgi:hypothetical protein